MCFISSSPHVLLQLIFTSLLVIFLLLLFIGWPASTPRPETIQKRAVNEPNHGSVWLRPSLFLPDQILVLWSELWSKAPFTPAVLVWTKQVENALKLFSYLKVWTEVQDLLHLSQLVMVSCCSSVSSLKNLTWPIYILLSSPTCDESAYTWH